MVPLSFALEFAGQEFRLVHGRALFWPREQALLVADLHLEKASFFASHGQMLPPYDSRETLERAAHAIRHTGARRVFALGDNFHDPEGPQRLELHAAGMLAALTRAVDWIWITGNHDGAAARIAAGGDTASEITIGGMILRHRAHPAEQRPELSGHFHPRLRVHARGRRIVRACAVKSDSRLILPAFGALTGGMDAADPAIVAAMQPARRIEAIVTTKDRVLSYPLWQAAA